MPSGPGNWLGLMEMTMLRFIFCFVRPHILSRDIVRQRRIPRLVQTSRRSFWTCTGKLNALIILQDLQERLKCSFRPPWSRGNADSSGSARRSREWLNPSPSQCTDALPFSLNWADFMFRGAQEPMAPWAGMKSPGLLFPALDEIRPDKADPWFPSLPKASPAHPGTLPRSPSSAPRSAQPTARELHVSSGNPAQASFHRGYLLAWKVSWAIFLPLFPSPPPPQPSPSKGDEMPRRNVTPPRKFRFGA